MSEEIRLGYSSMTAGIYDLDEMFRLANDLSLAFVELSYDVHHFLPQAQPARRVAELSRATGVAVTLHLPFIDLNVASFVNPVRCAAVEQTSQALEYAERTGALCAVMHTGTVFIYQPRPLPEAVDILLESLNALPRTTIPIALENLGLYPDGLVRGPEMLRDITEHSGLSNCLDFGHAHIEAGRPWLSEDAPCNLLESYLEILGKNIIHFHLSNNDRCNDLHAPTPDGTLSFEDFAFHFKTFQGTVCLEVAGGANGVRRSVNHIRSLVREVVPLSNTAKLTKRLDV